MDNGCACRTAAQLINRSSPRAEISLPIPKPDGSWKGTGTCTDNYPEGKISLSWEEGSDLKEYTYTKTSGTGKYQGVKGGGTYMYQNLTDTLSGGRYKGTLQLP